MLHRQSHRRLPQPRPEHVLVWRHARQALERAQEMVWAEARLSRQASEGETGTGMTVDHPHDSCHPRHGIGWSAVPVGREAGREPDRLHTQLDAELLPG